MKFDLAIGNPPYQSDSESMHPIYPDFMENAFHKASVVEVVTPGRFLFNAGKTPSEWNERVLSDSHFRVLLYFGDSREVFQSVRFMGGVAVTCRDIQHQGESIGVFLPQKELRSIFEKVRRQMGKSLADSICLQSHFNLEVLFADCPRSRKLISSGGQERRLTGGVLGRIPVFHEEKQSDADVLIVGVVDKVRVCRWIDSKYIVKNPNFDKFKVLVPKSYGASAVIDGGPTIVIGKPTLADVGVGYTQSFVGIGNFVARSEAEACLKYVRSKFARCMVGVLKVTQHNPRGTWKYVPEQDFSEQSDIDWGCSVADIDKQLYAKYGLSSDEIAFIEGCMKEFCDEEI